MILLENSIRSTVGGSILIKLKSQISTSPFITLEVVDSGTGFLNTFSPPFPNPKTL